MTDLSRKVPRRLATMVAGGVFVLSVGALGSGGAAAQTLEEALAQAYSTNPTLASQRAALRAADERVSQALSGYRPTVQGTLSAGGTRTNSAFESAGGNRSTSAATPKSAGLSVTQPIYDATVGPNVRRTERLVEAQRATVVNTEQQVLLNAATAYLDLVQNQAVLTLNTNNEQVLRRQLEAARDRFRVGEYTRTDVSQSESRLAASIANRISSEGTVAASRAVYERFIGTMPGKNLKAPKPTFKLPATLDEVAEMARANHPSVLAAAFTEAAQRDAVDQQFGRLLPSARLTAQGSRTYDPGTSSGLTINRQDSGSFQAQVVIPLYSAGQPEALVREAKETANQARIQIDETRRQVAAAAISSWQGLMTARASIDSFQTQIKAAQIALEGVRQEAQVGSRTVLDVLNQEQELLNGRVNLVRAQRDEMVQAFTVLSAIGQLTAQQLRLPVQYYDLEAHYRATRDKWIGTGVAD
ncbi:TolC family outer membrane protein [Azospirillum sp. TSO22-1]|uniref:TolC family outer membrane protein n=1 Tax=Azospirillum sp. TSO22-1 TaxID=716789 RepID=UPI001FFFA8ED|nr:TolC family outer membrane protein [Azospirillum sp. TSO22-1]